MNIQICLFCPPLLWFELDHVPAPQTGASKLVTRNIWQRRKTVENIFFLLFFEKRWSIFSVVSKKNSRKINLDLFKFNSNLICEKPAIRYVRLLADTRPYLFFTKRVTNLSSPPPPLQTNLYCWQWAKFTMGPNGQN